MDVRLPNGRIIKGVPEGTPKDEIKRKAVAAGLISDSDFPKESTPTPIRDEGFRFYNSRPQVQEQPAEEAGPVARESVPSQQSVEPYVEPTLIERGVSAVNAVGNEVKRSVLGGVLVPAAQTLLSLNNAVRSMLGGEVSPEEKRMQQTAIAAGLSIISADANRKTSFISLDKDGQVQYDRPETFAGTIAPYIVAVPAGFSWVAGSTLLKGLSAASRITIASMASDVAVNQLITDPNADNLVDMLEDAFPGDSGLKTLTAYLSTEEDDPEIVRRIKMAGQDTLLSAAFAGSAAFIGMLRGIKTPEAAKAVEKGVDQLSPRERGELLYQVLQNAKEGAKPVVRPVLVNGKPLYRNGSPVVEQVRDANGNPVWRSYAKPQGQATPGAPTPAAAPATTSRTLAADELKQIEAQAGSSFSSQFNRLWNQTFTSRGYWTKTLFDMSQKSQSEQRALISEANHVATRLNTSIDRVARSVASSTGATVDDATNQLMERVHTAFTSGNSADIAALPEAVRTEVVTARAMIDNLTQRMIDSPAVYDEFKKTLIDGQGKYLRRSYEAYTNPSYVPSATARSEAVEFLTKENMAQGMPFDEAAKLAEGRVVALLERDGRGLDAYVNDAVRVNTSVFSQRKDVPEELRKLLGEIVNPGDNVIQSARKLVGFVQSDQFSRDLLEIGDGKFLFDSPQGIYTTPITGTNTVLDVVEQGTAAAMPAQTAGRGRYTTPEMARAIMGKQVSFVDPAADDLFSKGLRAFIGWKGMSQSAKTIYSHTTHFKNLLGASMMRAANGSNPLGSATQAWRAVSNEIGGGVDVAAQKVYEDYLRLGIINTDVRLGDISEMMKTALDNPNGLGDWFVRKADEFNSTLGTVADVAVNAPRAVYMGTDDFFKIGEFEDYYAMLKKAFPNESDDVLKERAAKVVRDVLPNYDLVPNAIKQLRTLPFGNFVGFPSEVVRTSTNIIRLGFDEITSGNPVLYERGLRRLAAFTAFGGAGTEGLSNLTKTLAGLTSEEEQRAVDVVSRTPWSQDPTVFMVRDAETGELYKADTNSLDPYDFFRAPAKAALRQVAEGTMTKQELDAMLMEASGAFFKTVLKPFVSEAIVTEALINAWVGWTSPEGETRTGVDVSAPGMSGIDSAAETLKIFWETVEPGFMTSARRFADEYSERYKQYTGEPTDPKLAAINQLGLTWAKLDLNSHIEFVAGDYLDTVANSDTLSIDYRSTPEQIISKYEDINRDRYQAQRILYEQTEAANTLGLDTLSIRNILSDRGLNQEEVWGMATGQFYPTPLSNDILSRIRDQVYARGNNHSMSYDQLVSKLRETRASMENNSLMTFEDTTPWRSPTEEGEAILKEGPLTRLLKARGGVVVVPNAPTFPAARRDKLTGLPYDLQAGGSYIEDNPMARLLKACGGPVERQKKAGGGVVKALLKAVGRNVDEALPVSGRQVVTQAVQATGEQAMKPAAVKSIIERMAEASKLGFSDEYAEGYVKFGPAEMTREARMARAKELGFVDENFYHGTGVDFDEFDLEELGGLTKADSAREGFFFSKSPRTTRGYSYMSARKQESRFQDILDSAKRRLEEAKEIGDEKEIEGMTRVIDVFEAQISGTSTPSGQQTLPVRLRFSNPKIVEMGGTSYSDSNRPRLGAELRKAKEEGYDAVIFRNFNDKPFSDEFDWDEALDSVISDPDSNPLKVQIAEEFKSYGSDIDKEAMARKLSRESREIAEMMNPDNRERYFTGVTDDTYMRMLRSETRDFARNWNIAEPKTWDHAVRLSTEAGDVFDLLKKSERDFTDQIVVFKPEQIRSVNATFDPHQAESPRLLKAGGGVVGRASAACSKILGGGV